MDGHRQEPLQERRPLLGQRLRHAGQPQRQGGGVPIGTDPPAARTDPGRRGTLCADARRSGCGLVAPASARPARSGGAAGRPRRRCRRGDRRVAGRRAADRGCNGRRAGWRGRRRADGTATGTAGTAGPTGTAHRPQSRQPTGLYRTQGRDRRNRLCHEDAGNRSRRHGRAHRRLQPTAKRSRPQPAWRGAWQLRKRFATAAGNRPHCHGHPTDDCQRAGSRAQRPAHRRSRRAGR